MICSIKQTNKKQLFKIEKKKKKLIKNEQFQIVFTNQANFLPIRHDKYWIKQSGY